MRDIEMKFDKEELEILIRLIYTGAMIVENEEHKYGNKIDEILERALQAAKAHNVLKGVEYDNELGKHSFNSQAEENILHEYSEFVEDSFWEELIYRLAQRDIIDEIGEEKYKNMKISDRIAKEDKAEIVYDKEFEKNGYQNLRIAKGK